MTGIKVYSTSTCPWCTKLKEYLDEKKVKYESIDVSQDQEAAQAMVKKSGQMGVPQTEINGKIIVGFDKEAIDKELAELKE
jgi:glutaredoxin 3